MGEKTTLRPSPAIVVVAVALVAALAGTALAGTDATTSAISKKKVKKIATKQINKRLPLDTEDIADGAVTSAKLADGAVGTVMRQGPTVTVPPEDFRSADASCNPGEHATGGGAYNTGNVFFGNVTSSHPTPNSETPPPTGDGKVPTGWRVWVANTAPSGTQPVNAYVICASN